MAGHDIRANQLLDDDTVSVEQCIIRRGFINGILRMM